MYTLEQLQSKTFGELKKIGGELNVLPAADRRLRQTWVDAIVGVNPPLLALLEVSPAEVEQVQQPIIETVEPSPGVEVEPIQNPFLESKFGRIVYPRPASKAIELAAKTSPAVKVDRDDAPECSHCFDDGFIEGESGLIKSCHCNCEPKLSRQKARSAIAPATSDLNPNLTGVSLSDRFLARYSPPQSETLKYEITDGYKVDTDGQLSLFEARVVTEPDPPDPDDFESLDAFREAIALWDAQNPEPLAVSLDSMCEWAPCPEEWYEPKAEILPLKASSMIELPEQSEVVEHLRAGDSCDTSDFFIPTFDRLGDRSNGSDEPPDTGIFARLPKPKPPNFPPQAASQPQQVVHKLNTSWTPGIPKLSRNYPETIPKLFPRVVASSSTQPARSPPGGDAMK